MAIVKTLCAHPSLCEHCLIDLIAEKKDFKILNHQRAMSLLSLWFLGTQSLEYPRVLKIQRGFLEAMPSRHFAGEACS